MRHVSQDAAFSRSNYHPADGVQFALWETRAWIHLCTTLILIFLSWNLLEVFIFRALEFYAHFKLAIYIKKCQLPVSVNEQWDVFVCVSLCSVGRQINSFWTLHFVQNINGSPHLSYRWHSPDSVCMDCVCIYVCLLQRDESCLCELWSMYHCVYVCVWQPPLFLCLPPTEGTRADDIAQAAEQLNQRWVGFCALLAERLAWLAYQAKVHAHTHTDI